MAINTFNPQTDLTEPAPKNQAEIFLEDHGVGKIDIPIDPQAVPANPEPEQPQK